MGIFKSSMFSPGIIKDLRDGVSVPEKFRKKTLSDIYPADLTGSWKFSAPDAAMQNTRQVPLDWSDFTRHTFFNSAEAKVNAAYHRVVNEFPFDDTFVEQQKFLNDLNGYENYIYNLFPKYKGYLTFENTLSSSVIIEDSAGYLFPSIAKDKSLRSIVGSGINNTGFTVEAWFATPKDIDIDNQVIFQKIDADGSSKQGFTLAISQSDSASATSSVVAVFSSGSTSTSYLQASANIIRGQFNHIAAVYDKTKSAALFLYVNGKLAANSENFLEISNIDFLTSSINIGSGSSHMMTSTGFIPKETLSGSIDDLKVWTIAKPISDISASFKKQGYKEDYLGLYLKFNEPTGSYGNKAICLDHSGNGLHGQISNYAAAIRTTQPYENPITYEKLSECPVLFPDYPVLVAKNTELLISASRFDANNPNLITRLVPPHYFDQERALKSISNPDDENKQFGYQEAMPRGGQLPAGEIMAAMLYIWGSFFDDLKIFIDAFGKVDSPWYTAEDNIPPKMMMAMAARYGFNLTNPFESASPEQFHYGFDLTEDNIQGSMSLKDTMHTMHRYFLTEMPHIIRQKGTIAGIRTFMNSFGIDPDSNFRIREYGGTDSVSVGNYRIPRKEGLPFLNITASDAVISSSHLTAYRHEPGLPYGGPAPSRTLLEAGDIRMEVVNAPPSIRTLTSASWAWESHYILDNTKNLATQSLFRLDVSSSALSPAPVFNLLAYSGTELYPEKYGLRAILCDTPDGLPIANLHLPNINIFDGEKWYINVSNHYGIDRSKLEISAIDASGETIWQEYTTNSFYANNSASPLSEYDVSDTDHPFGPNISIGGGVSYRSKYLNNSYNSTDFASTDFFGRIGGTRFWSKALTRQEQREHALNMKSVGAENPMVNYNFAFHGYNVATSSESPNTFTPGGGIAADSWGRLRAQYDFTQERTGSHSDGTLTILDFAQNGIDLKITGLGDNKRVITDTVIQNSILDPNWDSVGSKNKIRIRSFLSEDLADRENVKHGALYSLDPTEPISDDRRFSIEASIAHPLNEDIVNILAGLEFINNAVGAPEMMYSVNYPILDRLADKYFNRLTDKMQFKQFLEFFKWFDSNFGSMIEKIIPRTTEFLGVNFVIESHMLERHKLQYQQADVHIDLRDRLAARIEPLFIGQFKRGNT